MFGDIHVTKFVFIKSGMFHDQYAHPYQVNSDNIGIALDLAEATNYGETVNRGTVSGIAGQIIQPTREAGRDIRIAEGWNERRYMFMMEFEENTRTQGTIRKIVTGYTDHAEQSILSDDIDPNTRMYFNNIIVMTPHGSGWRILENSQLLCNDLITFGGSSRRDSSVTLRPVDVFNKLSTNLRDKGEGRITDYRQRLNRGPRKTRRDHADHNNYFANLTSYWLGARNDVEEGVDPNTRSQAEIAQTAKRKAVECRTDDDLFLNRLQDEAGYGDCDDFITYGRLLQIAPSAQHAMYNAPVDENYLSKTHFSDYTEHFRGSNEENVVITTLQNAVPAAMLQNMIVGMHVIITNDNHMGETNIKQVMPSESWLDANSQVFHERENALFRHIRDNLMRDLTRNGEIILSIDIECHLLTQTVIKLSYDGYPPITFAVPTFADALFSPMVASNDEELANIATDTVSMASIISDRALVESGLSPNASSGILDSSGRPLGNSGDQWTGEAGSWSNEGGDDWAHNNWDGESEQRSGRRQGGQEEKSFSDSWGDNTDASRQGRTRRW